jgi:hypothetical protein
MKRLSRKQVQEWLNQFDLELTVYENLGNRKNYWYTYSAVNKNTRQRVIKECKDLREVMREVSKI